MADGTHVERFRVLGLVAQHDIELAERLPISFRDDAGLDTGQFDRVPRAVCRDTAIFRYPAVLGREVGVLRRGRLC